MPDTVGFKQREHLIDQRWIDCFCCDEEFSVTLGAGLGLSRLTTHSTATTSLSAWKARVRGLNHTEQSLNTETPPIRITQAEHPTLN